MKRIKIFFAAATLLLSGTAYSQFNKGATLFGGDISFNSYKTENLINPDTLKSHTLTFSPVFAKAIKNNLFFGVNIILAASENTFAVNGETKTKTFGAGFFLRKYKNIFGKFHAFVQAGVHASNYTSRSKQSPGYDVKLENFSAGVSVTPGISVAVSKKLFLEAGFSNVVSAGYSSGKQSGTNYGSPVNSKSQSFGFSSSLGTGQAGLFFGARIIIPR